MTGPEFSAQMQRLERHFGKKQFSQEFVELVFREIGQMTAYGLQRAVDTWIGTRAHTRPPLLTDFRDASLAEAKRFFQREVSGAADWRGKQTTEQKLKALRKAFGHVESIGDAIEVAKVQNGTNGFDGIYTLDQLNNGGKL